MLTKIHMQRLVLAAPKYSHSPKFLFNLQNILQYITKDRDTYRYITEIEKNLGECT
jgi:hypothetical protein